MPHFETIRDDPITVSAYFSINLIIRRSCDSNYINSNFKKKKLISELALWEWYGCVDGDGGRGTSRKVKRKSICS